MGEDYGDFELISFHSVSKGVAAECGRRGGYFELTGIDPRVNAQFYKLASVSLCPNISGQFMLDLVLNPPQEGDPSYALYHKETTEIFASLKRRSEKLCAALNALEGVSCNKATVSYRRGWLTHRAPWTCSLKSDFPRKPSRRRRSRARRGMSSTPWRC